MRASLRGRALLAMAAALFCAASLTAEPALALDCVPTAAPAPVAAAPGKVHKPHRKPAVRKAAVRKAAAHKPKVRRTAAHRPKAVRKAPRVIPTAAPANIAGKPGQSIVCHVSPPGPLMSVIPMTFAEAAPPPASGDFASAPQLPAYAQEALGTDASAIAPDAPKPGVGPWYTDVFGRPLFPGGGLVPAGFGGGFGGGGGGGGGGQPPVIGQPPEGGNPPVVTPPGPPVDQPPTVIETFPGPDTPPGGGQPPTVIDTFPPDEPPFVPQPPGGGGGGGGGGGAVPEPGTWALMILGFGLAGAALRRARTALRV